MQNMSTLRASRSLLRCWHQLNGVTSFRRNLPRQPRHVISLDQPFNYNFPEEMFEDVIEEPSRINSEKRPYHDEVTEPKDWKKYVSDRKLGKREQGMGEILANKSAAPENYVRTFFGSIRTDEMNRVTEHGQQDIFLEMQEKLENQEEVETEIEDLSELNVARQQFVTSSVPDKGEDNDDRNFFFETADIPKKFVTSAGVETKVTPSEKKNQPLLSSDVRVDQFSFQPASHGTNHSVQKKAEVPTLKPTFNVSESNTNDNSIDEQYFPSLLGTEPATEDRKEIRSTNDVAQAKDNLDFIDSQYFPNNYEFHEHEVETNRDEIEKVAKLVKDSTENLNFIDSQMFPSNQELKVSQERPLETQQIKKFKRDEIGEKMEVKKPKTLKEFRRAMEGSALSFVQKLRKSNDSKSAIAISKESFVKQIGVSLESRMSNVESSLPTQSSSKKEMETKEDTVHFHGPLNEKFRPVNLWEKTSLDIKTMLHENILYNNNDILAINKPYGLPMANDGKAPHSVLKYLPDLAEMLEVPTLYSVHRLDQTTTGILLFAKSVEMKRTLTRLFRKRLVDKRYWTIVTGTPQPSQGIINIPIGEVKIGDRYRMSVQPDYSMSKVVTNKRTSRKEVYPAVTEYNTLSTRYHTALLEVKPITGFRHQIRTHLALGIGCAILGDHKFSHVGDIGKPQRVSGDVLQRFKIRKSKSRDLPILLHAKHVQIPDILSGKQIWIDAPLPHHFNRAMKHLKLKPSQFVSI